MLKRLVLSVLFPSSMVSLATGVTSSIAVCVSQLTAIMQEQAQRITAAGIKSGFVGKILLYDRRY